MKKSLLTILALSVILTAGTTAQAACPGRAVAAGDGCCTIGVRTNMDKEIQSDMAKLSFTVETRDKDMTKASDRNKVLSDSLSKALKAGIKADKGDTLETANYSVRPTYIYDKENKRLFDKYVVTNNYVLTVKDLSNLGKLIDLGISKGATSVSDLTFDVSDETSFCQALLKETTANAKAQAEAVAQSLGYTVTKAHKINVSCGAQPVSNSMYRGMMATEAGAAKLDSASTTIEPSKVKIWADVTAEFKFK